MLINGLWGTPLSAVSTLLLVVFAASLLLQLARMRHYRTGHDVASLAWLLHGTAYYVTVLLLRLRGVELGGPLTEVITLWSSALRLHIVLSVGAVEVLRRRYRV